MWRISLRDLQWRRRRFGIAIGGTALVFGITLLLAGFSSSFRTEVDNTIQAVGADSWVVREGMAGPFTAGGGITPEQVQEVGHAPGVRQADPMVVMRLSVKLKSYADIDMFGFRPGGIGQPPVTSGRSPIAGDEAAVNDNLDLKLGDNLDVGAHHLKVVGLTHGLTLFGSVPNVYVPIEIARGLAFNGAPMSSTVVTRGTPTSLPSGLHGVTNADAKADAMRPLLKAIRTIDLLQIFLWIVAASIIGSVMYLSAMERVRDFAVLKATGASDRTLLLGLAAQAVLVALASALVGELLSLVLPYAFPIPVTTPLVSALSLPLVALVVGLVASVAGVRRALAVDPASAFGGP
jgi:putative ABC transport system permease protein